ncbi:MAG: TraR/DksA C4-type zinc finger protein [Patescibacteria group bacterium]|nr:TraR/DksA C4-type zinc finger protein [Patescibacteria group bacterium]
MMLDQQKIQEFKEKLLQEKTKLEKELGDVAKKEDDGDYEAKFEDYGRNEEDNAEEVEEYTTKIGITETLEKNLTDVNDALIRIEDGKYGICENCPEEIRVERLEAYPAARKCMKCESQKIQ